MVIGVGIDLVLIERIKRAYWRRPERFVRRIFTETERSRLQPLQPPRLYRALAARFAAKEAVLKAVGCGIGPAGLKDVEVLAAPGGRPQVRLHGHALSRAQERGIAAVELSMTHEERFAGAIAVAYNRQ